MNTTRNLVTLGAIALLMGVTLDAKAVTASAQIYVNISRHITMINVADLSFGDISVNNTAGSVMINADGSRQVNGGVTLGGNGMFQPARFVIEGAPNISFVLSFPELVEMTDGQGNTIRVDKFNTNTPLEGLVGSSGTQELNLGGRLNLDANQPTGAYSGTVNVELEYR